MHVTIFSTGGKFRPVRSYTLLLQSPVLMPSWSVCIFVNSSYTFPPNLPQLSSERELAKETHTSLSNTLALVRTTHEHEKREMEEERRKYMAELDQARYVRREDCNSNWFWGSKEAKLEWWGEDCIFV